MRNTMKPVYENMAYEENEIKQDKNYTKDPENAEKTSQIVESPHVEKQVKIDRFWAQMRKTVY